MIKSSILNGRRYGMVWYGMAWHGMAWHGMAWHGMAWYGMVWYGMVLSQFKQFYVNIYITYFSKPVTAF